MVFCAGSCACSACAEAAAVGEQVLEVSESHRTTCGCPREADLWQIFPPLVRWWVILREKQMWTWDQAEFRQLPWGWRFALCVWIHGLYMNAVTFLSLQCPLQKLSSRMSRLLDVGGSGTAFLVDWGTKFLGNDLRRCYFCNSHPQGLEEGRGRGRFVRLAIIKREKKPQPTVFSDAACLSSKSTGF